MRQFIFLSFFIFLSIKLSAQKIYGTVTSENGALLPFASITIKGTSSGVSANKNAHYTFNLPEGTYQLVCQYIGYEIVEKTVVLKEDQKLDFTLKDQKLLMKEVVVKKGGEDPAYEIIRQAIKKRSYYNNQVKHFSVELYTKDLIKLRSLPKKIFGQKIPERDKKEMGVDSTGKGIIYLSEATSKVSAEFPNKFKMDVLGSRVSGGDGFGFTFPVFISLYKNNVNVFTEKLNPRGFVSPIADGAISFYKYKYLGTFIENGKAINTIKVTPRRNEMPSLVLAMLPPMLLRPAPS